MSNAIVPAADRATATKNIKSAYQAFGQATGEWVRSALSLGKAAQDLFEAWGSPQAGGFGGVGLKSILEEEAPDLNYVTVATCWNMYKKGVAALGGGNKGAAALLGMTSYFNERGQEVALSKALIQKRDTLFLEGTSRRKFLIMMAQMGQGSAGRKPGENLESYQHLRRDPKDNAAMAWAKVFAKIPNVLPEMAALLDYNLADMYLKTLEPLVSALKKRVNDEAIDV